MGSVKVQFLALLYYQVVLDCFQVDGVEGLPGQWMVLLWRISLDKGIIGTMGVDCRFSRSLMDLSASWVVLRVVFRVLTCCMMKPLDQGRG